MHPVVTCRYCRWCSVYFWTVRPAVSSARAKLQWHRHCKCSHFFYNPKIFQDSDWFFQDLDACFRRSCGQHKERHAVHAACYIKFCAGTTSSNREKRCRELSLLGHFPWPCSMMAGSIVSGAMRASSRRICASIMESVGKILIENFNTRASMSRAHDKAWTIETRYCNCTCGYFHQPTSNFLGRARHPRELWKTLLARRACHAATVCTRIGKTNEECLPMYVYDTLWFCQGH